MHPHTTVLPAVTWWQAIILGLAQGLTEFIPVSSSAHLNILHWIFGQSRDLPFDVMLHIGTLAALAYYFRNEWIDLLTNSRHRKLLGLVLLACVPAVIGGLLLRKLEDQSPFSEVWFNAVLLIVGGLLLWGADRIGRKTRTLEDVQVKDAILIGSAQVLALMPGMSRSGSTIMAGMALGFTREAAARYSFLVSLPITTGAAAFEFKGLMKEGGLHALNASPGVMLLGILVSGASGFWAIGFLLNYLKSRDVTLFVVWRIIVALLVFALISILHR